MTRTATITVLRQPEEVKRLWRDGAHNRNAGDAWRATFSKAPADHGTEICIEVEGNARGGVIGKAVKKVGRSDSLARARDDLRRFKQLVETGEITRSDAAPEGELVERKLEQRPAQPLESEQRVNI
jgi:uncharacterized membrane protein